MREAIKLAEKARFRAPPNPWVGCLIVKEGKIVGQGFTQDPGQDHAEIAALKVASENALGASLYATLEPCSHTGRTPPCTDAIIKAGIRKVFIGIKDPDQQVDGKGITLLQKAGIEVSIGICEEEIKRSLAPYLHQRKTGLPYTVLKAAISIDGRIAAEDSSSQWITSLEALQDTHFQRASSQAILVGSGTALHDSPRLTARHPLITLNRQPLRILLDGRGRVPAIGPLFDTTAAPTLVFTTSLAPLSRQNEWLSAGAEVIVTAPDPKGVNLEEVWSILGKRSILQVLVEGGAMLHTSLLESSLVNRALIYVGPLLLGPTGSPFYKSEVSTLTRSRRFSLDGVQKFGDSVRLDYRPKKKDG